MIKYIAKIKLKVTKDRLSFDKKAVIICLRYFNHIVLFSVNPISLHLKSCSTLHRGRGDVEIVKNYWKWAGSNDVADKQYQDNCSIVTDRWISLKRISTPEITSYLSVSYLDSSAAKTNVQSRFSGEKYIRLVYLYHLSSYVKGYWPLKNIRSPKRYNSFVEGFHVIRNKSRHVVSLHLCNVSFKFDISIISST